MKNKEITKNLKHGYIFLVSTLLFVFLLSLSIEIYLRGGFQFPIEENPPVQDEMIEETPNPEFLLEIQNLEDGFKTKDAVITLVGSANENAFVVINNKEVGVNEGKFESKIELVVGNNEIVVQGYLDDELQKEIKLEVIREEKEEKPKEEEVEKKEQNGGNIPQPTPAPQTNPQPNPTPTPKPEPKPEPQPDPISGLKMSCSINNTYPSVGQQVSISCSVKDQNNNPVSGAFGYVTVNWKTGSNVYTLSQSNGSGAMSANFSVPSGNSGSISGNIKASKNGLNVSSNFTLNVQ